MILIYRGAESGIYHGFRAGQRMYQERIGMYCYTNKDIENVKAKMINDWGEGGRDNMQIRYPRSGKYVYIVARSVPNNDEGTRYCYFNCVRSKVDTK